MSLPQENLIRALEKRLGRELSADEKRLLLLAEEITEVDATEVNAENAAQKGKSAAK